MSASDINSSERARALETRGIAHRELGDFDRSVQDLNASLALLRDPGTMRMLAWTYREMAQYDNAERLYTEILKEDTHWQGWLSRCVVRQDMGHFDQALEDCSKALRQDEDNLDVLYFTARAYSFLERPKEAFPLLKKAMVLAPNQPRFLVENVWALYQVGLKNIARKTAREGLNRFPAETDLLLFLENTR